MHDMARFDVIKQGKPHGLEMPSEVSNRAADSLPGKVHIRVPEPALHPESRSVLEELLNGSLHCKLRVDCTPFHNEIPALRGHGLILFATSTTIAGASMMDVPDEDDMLRDDLHLGAVP